jgi:hypothetical protein
MFPLTRNDGPSTFLNRDFFANEGGQFAKIFMDEVQLEILKKSQNKQQLAFLE